VLIRIIAIAAVLFVGIQFVPVDRSNPPVEADVTTPADVKGVLERSCYDCHSNQTRWPWYSRVAPMSWLVTKDVHEGREHLNFSTWGLLSTKKQVENMEEIWEEVQEGEMPLWFYLPMHPEARISATDRAVLERWSDSRRSEPSHDD